MSLYKELIQKKEKLAVVGLGYVGLPLAIAFAKHMEVIGFDVNENKINLYKQGIDPTMEVGNAAIEKTTMTFTSDEALLKEAKFIIVAVPTPTNEDKSPDLTPVVKASELIGRNLTRGAIVVYESTVYPGVTEDICIAILEKHSGLRCGPSFKIGYSPERINPGDKVNTLERIVKIVSGMDEESLKEIQKTYELVIEAGVHPASSIKVAEAAKLLENSQRDVNIAFMNEVAMACQRMGIDTKEVIDAMNSKWNALNFHPGLVGGHCIGVDPYYFIHAAERLACKMGVIEKGREINEGMTKFIANIIIEETKKAGKEVKGANVALLGITFKENCPDTRNSKTAELYELLKNEGMNLFVVDPVADIHELNEEYGIKLNCLNELSDLDIFILAVPHEVFIKMDFKQWNDFLKNQFKENPVIIDVRSVLPKAEFLKNGYHFWRL